MEPKIKEKRAKTPEQALASLMRLCARAEKASDDARRLMTRWGLAPAAQEAVLKKLIEQRFIDDERYAAAFVREKTSLNGWGSRKIRFALQRKRIDREIIDRALAEIDREAGEERLLSQLQRKLRTVRAATPYDLRTKLIRYGLSLGYEYEQVADRVAQLIQDDDACEPFFD